jgi:hypothetical protein
MTFATGTFSFQIHHIFAVEIFNDTDRRAQLEALGISQRA